MKRILLFVFLLLSGLSQTANAQYLIEGHVTTGDEWGDVIYLSLVDSRRGINGIRESEFLHQSQVDSNGYFRFAGNDLPDQLQLLRLHLSSANNESEVFIYSPAGESNHALFMASNSDSVKVIPGKKGPFGGFQPNGNPRLFYPARLDSIRQKTFREYRDLPSTTNEEQLSNAYFREIKSFYEEQQEPLLAVGVMHLLTYTEDFEKYFQNDLARDPDFYQTLRDDLNAAYPDAEFTKEINDQLEKAQLWNREKNPEAISNGNMGLKIALGAGGLVVLALIVFVFKRKPSPKQKTDESPDLRELLTRQEVKVADLIAADKTNKEIADELNVSVSTVKSHLNTIYRKTGVKSRADLGRKMRKSPS